MKTAFMKEEKNEEKKLAAEVVGIEPMPVESTGELQAPGA